MKKKDLLRRIGPIDVHYGQYVLYWGPLSESNGQDGQNKKEVMERKHLNRPVTEWLGGALQKLLQRFESARGINTGLRSAGWFALPILVLISCKEIKKEVVQTLEHDTEYLAELSEWRAKRINSLKEPQGWLNLAGLFWLAEGDNRVGSSPQNTVIFPIGKSDAFLGTYVLEQGKVSFAPVSESPVHLNGTPITRDTGIDFDGPAVLFGHQNLRWAVIKRGERYAIRLWDLDSELSKSFQGAETFPASEKWKVKARFSPAQGKLIPITDITNRKSEEESPGTLFFALEGKEYQLDALGSEDSLFVIFGDATNGKGTYHSGRFLYASAPDEKGYTYLDFNRAYNPPCAFTPYSTCPLPPAQNILPIAVEAGEKEFVAKI